MPGFAGGGAGGQTSEGLSGCIAGRDPVRPAHCSRRTGPVTVPSTVEHRRLMDSAARRADWKNWGPYLAERAWGTVREDYSLSGDAWNFFPHDHARSRAYR